jgi:hypothetical protein
MNTNRHPVEEALGTLGAAMATGVKRRKPWLNQPTRPLLVAWGSPTLEQFKLWGQSPKEAAMTRSKFSIKAVLLAGGIGLSMAAFAGSQPAAAQSYTCPVGTVYDPTYGCTSPDEAYAPYDYGYYGYMPYDGYGRAEHHEFGHGFGHGMGGGFDHGMGFAHAGGGFGHGMTGGFHGGGGGHR